MSHRLVPMFAGVALVGVLVVGLISQMGLSHGAFGAMAQPATPTEARSDEESLIATGDSSLRSRMTAAPKCGCRTKHSSE